jgi:hypothetical protein
MVESLGADRVFDYTKDSWVDDAKQDGLYVSLGIWIVQWAKKILKLGLILVLKDES